MKLFRCHISGTREYLSPIRKIIIIQWHIDLNKIVENTHLLYQSSNSAELLDACVGEVNKQWNFMKSISRYWQACLSSKLLRCMLSWAMVRFKLLSLWFWQYRRIYRMMESYRVIINTSVRGIQSFISAALFRFSNQGNSELWTNNNKS